MQPVKDLRERRLGVDETVSGFGKLLVKDRHSLTEHRDPEIAAGSTLPDTGRLKSRRPGPFLPDTEAPGFVAGRSSRSVDGRRRGWTGDSHGTLGEELRPSRKLAKPEDASLRRGLGSDSTPALWPPYSVKVNMVPAPTATSSTCLLPVGNFSRRINLIRERRNVETKENKVDQIMIMQSLSIVKDF